MNFLLTLFCILLTILGAIVYFHQRAIIKELRLELQAIEDEQVQFDTYYRKDIQKLSDFEERALEAEQENAYIPTTLKLQG